MWSRVCICMRVYKRLNWIPVYSIYSFKIELAVKRNYSES